MPCTAARPAPDGPWEKPVEGPCGTPIPLSVAGKDVSTESLCQLHWSVKHGHLAVKQPLVVEP